MFQKYSAYLSWPAFLAAVLIWLSVGLFAWTIRAEKEIRASKDFDTEFIATTQDASLRLRALARDTREERALLDQIAGADITRIVDTIEMVGRDAGVSLEIGQAFSAPSGDTPNPANTVSFFVAAEGTFSAVMRTAELLGSLPMPSLIEAMQFERVALPPASGRGVAAWQLGVRVRFLTTSDISS